MRMTKTYKLRVLMAVIAMAFAGLLAGCGGGGGSAVTPSASGGRQVGSITIKYEFPRSAAAVVAGRSASKVPDNTQSIAITVSNSAGDYDETQTLTAEQSSATFNEIPVGEVKVTLSAKDADGNIVAHRIEVVNIVADTTTKLDTTLGITITDDGLVPKDLQVNAGERLVWVNNSSNVVTITIPNTDCSMTLKKMGVLSCTFTTAMDTTSYTDAQSPSVSGTVRVMSATTEGLSYADASADTTYGGAPLAVNFMAAGAISGASSLTYSWNFGDGTQSDAATLSTLDKSLNTISHIYAASGAYEAVLTVTDGTTTQQRNLRIFVGAASSVTAHIGAEPTAAKQILFGQTDSVLTEAEVLQAQALLLDALQADPGNAEANFLMGLVSLMLEGQRIYDVLDYSVDDGDNVFPFTKGEIPQVTSRVAAALIPTAAKDTGIMDAFGKYAEVTSTPGPRTITSESGTGEIQAELFRVAGNVDSAVYYLGIAKQYLESNPSAYFTIPRNIFSPGLNYYIDKGDLQMIAGALEYLQCFIYAGTAYFMDENGFDFDVKPTDADSSGYFEPSETLPSGNWGTLRSDGVARMAKAKTALEAALADLESGIDFALSETTESNEIMPVAADPKLKEDLKSAKNAVQFMDDLTHIDLTAESSLKDIVVVNLGAMFDTPPADWKALAPTCIDEGCKYFKRDSSGLPYLPDRTLGGLIPGGFPDSAWMAIDNAIDCLCSYNAASGDVPSSCMEVAMDVEAGINIPDASSCPLEKTNSDTTGMLASVPGLSTLLGTAAEGVLEADFTTAKSQIMSNLSSNPNDANANMAAFIAALVEEGEAQKQLGGSTIFPFKFDISSGMFHSHALTKATAGVLGKAISEAQPEAAVDEFAALGNALPRIVGRTITPYATPMYPTYDEVRREALEFAKSGGTADILVGYLDKVIATLGTNPGWYFDVPQNNKTTDSGWYRIDAGDVHILKGAIRFVQAWALYVLAYDLTGIDDYKNLEMLDAAAAADGVAAPSEYLPPSPFGNLTNSAYISTGKTYLIAGINAMLEGIDLTQAETADVNELLPYNSSATAKKKTDMGEYALKAIKAMFNGVLVPAYDDDLGVLSLANLAALFDTPIQSFRNIAPTFNEDGSYTLPDATFSGLFPNGFPGSTAFMDTGYGYYCINFYYEGDQRGHASSNYYDATITASIGGVSAQLSGCTVSLTEISVNRLAGSLVSISGTSASTTPSNYYMTLPASFTGYGRVYDFTGPTYWYSYYYGGYMYTEPRNVYVVLDDTFAPSVVSGETIASGMTFAGYPIISGFATDTGVIKTFEIYVDDTLADTKEGDYANNYTYGTSYNFHYRWNTTSLTNGSHNVKFKAIDGGGNSSYSPVYTITVDNSSTGTISGSVLSSIGTLKKPVRVAAFSTANGMTVVVGSAEADSAGAFTIVVPPGAYNVMAFEDKNGSYYPDYDSEYCGMLSTQQTVTAGSAITGADVTVNNYCSVVLNGAD